MVFAFDTPGQKGRHSSYRLQFRRPFNPASLHTLMSEFQRRSQQCKSYSKWRVRHKTPNGSVWLHCTHPTCEETSSSCLPSHLKNRDAATAIQFTLPFKFKVTTAVAAATTAAGFTADTANRVETIWSKLKDPLLDGATDVCALAKNHHWRSETWW